MQVKRPIVQNLDALGGRVSTSFANFRPWFIFENLCGLKCNSKGCETPSWLE